MSASKCDRCGNLMTITWPFYDTRQNWCRLCFHSFGLWAPDELPAVPDVSPELPTLEDCRARCLDLVRYLADDYPAPFVQRKVREIHADLLCLGIVDKPDEPADLSSDTALRNAVQALMRWCQLESGPFLKSGAADS
jgi:hypothetical protein